MQDLTSAESREPGNVQTAVTTETVTTPPAAPAPAKWVGNPTTATTPAQPPAHNGYVPPVHTPITGSRSYSVNVPVPREQPPCPEAVDPLLSDILTWPRTHESDAERRFCSWLAVTIKELCGIKPVIRSMGCLSVTIPAPDGRHSRSLFVAHVDTVDGYHKTGFISDDGSVMRKKLSYDPNFGVIGVDKDCPVRGCLGADDGVGVWILLKMISMRQPGSYLFTRGEEKGRLGASAMVANPVDAEWLRGFSLSVEFDRPRNYEVITHQSGGTRCASDKFGKELAERLNTSDHLAYEISNRGVYTDNYDFRGLIAENVNIGVGYTGQHGSGEELDYAHAHALMVRCVMLDFETLPVERTPVIERYAYPSGYTSTYGHGGQRYFGGMGLDDDDDVDAVFPRRQPFVPSQHRQSNVTPMAGVKVKRKRKARVETPPVEPDMFAELLEMNYEDFVILSKEEPVMFGAFMAEAIAEIASLRAKNASLLRILKKRSKQ